MEKESYSIDDILSEVKERKRRESNSEPKFEIKNKGKDSSNKNKEESKPEKPALQEKAENKKEAAVENKNSSSENIDKSEKKQKTEANKNNTAKKAAEEKKAAAVSPKNEKNKRTVHKQNSKDEAEPIAKAETDTEKAEKKPQVDKNGYVDLLAMAKEEETVQTPNELTAADTKEKKQGFFKTKKGRIVKTVIIILVFLIAVGGIFAGIYIKNALNTITDDENNNVQTETNNWSMSEDIENFPEIKEKEATQLSSLQDMIKSWYYNGAPCSSSRVLNVLLIGEDTRGDEILEEETRADSAIIVSVNVDTNTITLTSVLRDAYAYWENVPGDAETGEFGKINAAMTKGGINGYINCLEKLYKIDIDNYVIVNFDSFEKIIDEVGGVEIELTSAEIREINNNPDTYGYVTIEKTFEGASGVIELTGEQALAYCRIRHLDGDHIRADRQKKCLFEIFNKVQDLSSVKQLKIVNTLIPYVKTGFKSNEVVSITKYALSQGWLGFEVSMISVPDARRNEGSGGEFYGAWHWKADYPQDANFLQTVLYGKSSVILAQSRVDILRCNLYGFYEENLTPCRAVINNLSYGEATTYEITTEEESTSAN